MKNKYLLALNIYAERLIYSVFNKVIAGDVWMVKNAINFHGSSIYTVNEINKIKFYIYFYSFIYINSKIKNNLFFCTL